MHKRSFGIILLLFILLIAVFHNYATIHYIYWKFLWTDLVIHFLSGIWIALGGFWVFRYWALGRKLTVKKTFLVTVFFALIIGVFWEIFEYQIGIVEYSSRYTEDTILDIVMDILGGVTGFIVALFYTKFLDNT